MLSTRRVGRVILSGVLLVVVAALSLLAGQYLSSYQQESIQQADQRWIEEMDERVRQAHCRNNAGPTTPESIQLLIDNRCRPGLNWESYIAGLTYAQLQQELEYSVSEELVERLMRLPDHPKFDALVEGVSAWSYVSPYRLDWLDAEVVAWIGRYWGTEGLEAESVYRRVLVVGNINAIRVFQDAGRDINRPVPRSLDAECPGLTPPLSLVPYDHWPWMLQQGADPTISACEDHSPLISLVQDEYVPDAQQLSIAETLLTYSFPQETLDLALYFVVREQDQNSALIELLISKGASPFAIPRDRNQSTLAIASVKSSGALETVQVLLQRIDKAALAANVCQHLPNSGLLSAGIVRLFRESGVSGQRMADCRSPYGPPWREVVVKNGRYDLMLAFGITPDSVVIPENASVALWRIVSGKIPEQALTVSLSSLQGEESAATIIVRKSLEYGADPDWVTESGRTIRSYLIRRYHDSGSCWGDAEQLQECRQRLATYSRWLDLMEIAKPFYGSEDTLRIE